MLTVVITPITEADIDEAYEWWRKHRSVEQANRWYREILPVMQALRTLAAGMQVVGTTQKRATEHRQGD